MPISSAWTPALLDQLKACIDKKMSSGETASELGMTRSQVSGKAARMGYQFISVQGRPSPKRIRRKQLPRVIVFRQEPYREPIVETTTTSMDLPFDELKDGVCKYAYGDSAPYLFCGQPTEDKKPFCAFHHRVCYYPITPGKRVSL
jgi:hypothetical protein